MSAIDYSERQLLRQHIRHLRRHLTPEQQSEAAEQLAEHAINLAPVSAAQSIALFLSTDGEINTRPLIARLWQQKKSGLSAGTASVCARQPAVFALYP